MPDVLVVLGFFNPETWKVKIEPAAISVVNPLESI